VRCMMLARLCQASRVGGGCGGLKGEGCCRRAQERLDGRGRIPAGGDFLLPTPASLPLPVLLPKEQPHLHLLHRSIQPFTPLAWV
jgi:hypothetical protein